MSNSNRNVGTATFEQQDPTTVIDVMKSTIPYNSTAPQVPTPEPRRKLSHKHQLSLETSRQHENAARENGDKNSYSREQVKKLVNVHNRENQVYELNDPIYRAESQKRTSFNETPVEFTSDEGVGSPTNIEYDDEEALADDYYEDEEDEHSTCPTDDLADLSRQSMMPLHELIAYYQYIQQGETGVSREPVSRQSSVASQRTTKAKLDNIELKQHDVQPQSHADDDGELEDFSTSNEMACTKVQVPKLQVDNVDDTGQVMTINDEQSNLVNTTNLKDKRRIRANVVLELINSERDFVKHLRDVVEGYLHPARRHPEIFTGERIKTIFSNIEQLYEFQRKFLESLELCIDWEDLAESRVGHCFLEYENGFNVYHHYCNNHPNATSELQDLYTKPRFIKFFEACRLLQNMIDISLDGFLLTPIQKICKYPLQLNELLKNTDEDHPDFRHVVDALESMRNCANLANERKRRIEALADVMFFQEKVENWFGPKLSDTSSILIHSGEVSKMTSHTWSQGVQLYLFDHLLLYSKKDLLKRNSLILKGRICMDTVTEISDADEYKSKKSFKIYCSEQQKWFVFTTRSEKEKDEWIRAFERERNLIESDETEGFHITEKEIGVARRALQNRKHSRSARYRHKRPDTTIVDQLDIDDATTIMNRTLSLPSCIHPSHVMNFVEDSRVVSGRKKNSSPSSNSRSPNSSNQYLAEQDNQQQSTGASWFKKMGSKKLTKSQIYNVNGAGIGVRSSAKQTVSPADVITEVSTVNMTSTTNYDQLEKRHRDHMVGEEQARLFRLNNDLPSPLFAPTTSAPTTTTTATGIANRGKSNVRGAVTPSSRKQQGTSLTECSTNDCSMPTSLNFRSLNFNQSKQLADNDRDFMSKSESGDRCNEGTFEATVVLASGRVVRVREDTV